MMTKRPLITGAGGFIGQALAAALLADPRTEEVTLSDLTLPTPPHDPRIRRIEGSIATAGVRAAILAVRPDSVFHLASVPGGLAEQSQDLGWEVNLHATLALMHGLAAGAKLRVVYASSIAVFGAPLPQEVHDDTIPRPAMSYGTQKLMVELALADAARRGVLDPLCVRLPGVVARPYAASGLVSAFMSNLFHALAADEEIVLPVSPTGRAWLMSVDTAVANLLHAARVDTASLGVRRAITLPAVHATIHDLANSIGKACAVDAEARVRYDKVEDVEAQFAAYPPLFARQALALGFHDDATLAALTSRVLRRIKNSAEEN